MTTAYIIHNSEGVPVRRVVETIKDEGMIKVALHTAGDDRWVLLSDRTRLVHLDKYTQHNEIQHHLTLRYQLKKQYGYRFELYWPLTTIIS